MKRFTSHLYAIGIAALVMVGMSQLPAVTGWNVRSLFTIAWLLLASLALLAHMRRAKLIGQPRPVRRAVVQRMKRRGM